ncbi:DUF1887 domain-containing protein [Kamptonema sp. UHCC 0994]|uniref:DUF1887 domain-containing protein n=1 Tax=Kamptonema sp. UHCC 0994 TaxID=3031329 RepID=UPI0023BA4C16|nr:DUF1887 domain-containing protein [Kamptonema sp. UHCC 0994]MDF0556435.1 DUF1887 domain-containing protein [Kamptonema sp. UHCC 0994]
MSSNNGNDWEDHQVDHLFLLVGENPLPNYVAARLLIKPKTDQEKQKNPSIVYLVHTTKTAGDDKPAGLLEKELKKHNITIKQISLGDDESDGDKIRAKIKEKIQPKGKPPLQGRLGLNYTGGTKAMAVHAYQAFQELQLTDPVFSYLDSRKLAMHIDGKDKPIPVDLALSPAPKLEIILGLHNLSWKTDPIRQSQLPDIAEAFAKLHLNSDLARTWRKWCDGVFKSLKNTQGYWRQDSEFSNPPHLKLSVTTPVNVTVPNEIQEILRKELGWALTDELSLTIAKDKGRFTTFGDVCQWLDGGWLEDYVLSQVEKIATKYSLHDSIMSLHIKDPRNPNRPTDQFEFDVAFLRGYQLCGISCTTSPDHKKCKQKLFEAQLRVQQLGGDEARVALVCCDDLPSEWLKKELDFVVDDSKIEVFGRQDLEPTKFAKKLDLWIFRNAGK